MGLIESGFTFIYMHTHRRVCVYVCVCSYVCAFFVSVKLMIKKRVKKKHGEIGAHSSYLAPEHQSGAWESVVSLVTSSDALMDETVDYKRFPTPCDQPLSAVSVYIVWRLLDLSSACLTSAIFIINKRGFGGIRGLDLVHEEDKD